MKLLKQSVIEKSRFLPKCLNGESGIALLLVMWVIIILFVIAAEFSFTMRTELTITKNLKEDTECYYLAIAGVQLAVHELLGQYDNVYRDNKNNLILEDKRKSQIVNENPDTGEKQIEQLDVPPPKRSGIALGHGFFSYKIQDEDGKLNLNSVVRVDNRDGSPYQTLRKLLINSGVEPGLDVDIIMDSILDWRDSNDEHHLNGAEDDWYESNYEEQGFDYPYQAKNGPFDTVEELLMVRGVTKEILYGSRKAQELFGEEQTDDDGKDYRGIMDDLSTFNVGRRINRNTASGELIEAMFPDEAEQILDDREQKNGRYADRMVSSYYTVTSTGYLLNSDVQHTIRATIWKRGSGKNSTIQMQFWKDNELEETTAKGKMPEDNEQRK